jgi:ribonuclease D
MQWHWIDNDADLAEALVRHADCPDVAVDTEFRRRDTFYPQVALLQLCWNEDSYLIDPNGVKDTSPIVNLLQDTRVTKYLHSASEDLEVFERWLGVLPTPLFDTQRAAGLTGRDAGLSYRGLVLEFLGVEVPKDETQSDWLKRPLTESQQRYAALDVHYLIGIGRQLQSELTALNRLSWLLEDSARMSTGGRGPLAKFKSAWKLKETQRRALIGLVAWREQRARDRDKPRNWIADDKSLMAIASKMPGDSGELAALGLPEGLVRRQGHALLDCVEAARAGDACTDWHPLPPLSRSEKALAKALAEQRDLIARDLELSPEVLMPGRELELLLRRAMGEPVEQPEAWQGWRQAVAVAPLETAARSLINGESHHAG